MPKPSPFPEETWNQAMVLYAQGVRPTEIAQRLSIPPQSLYKRIDKGNWGNLLSQTRKNTEDALQKILQEADFRFRSAIAKRLTFLAQSLPDRALATAKEIGLQKELEPALRNAKTIFNWNDQSGTNGPTVRINILGSATVRTDTIKEPKESLSVTDQTPPPGGAAPSPGG